MHGTSRSSRGGDLYGFPRTPLTSSDTDRLVRHDSFVEGNLTTRAAAFIDRFHDPSKSSQIERKPPVKNDSRTKLFMYDNNDVIRKKIISTRTSQEAWCRKTVFAFSSWLYLILILWLFSDHIQMGIRRHEPSTRWDEMRDGAKASEINSKLFMMISAVTIFSQCLRVRHVHAVT